MIVPLISIPVTGRDCVDDDDIKRLSRAFFCCCILLDAEDTAEEDVDEADDEDVDEADVDDGGEHVRPPIDEDVLNDVVVLPCLLSADVVDDAVVAVAAAVRLGSGLIN
jgi:hypothetical protein